MNNQIKNFRIKNFKKFKSLEIEDIGQFNLFVGDNNIGKTTILEALLFEDKDLHSVISNLDYALFKRFINVNLSESNFIDDYYLNDKENKIISVEFTANQNKEKKISIEVKEVTNLNDEEREFLLKNILYKNVKRVVIRRVNNMLVEILPVDNFDEDFEDESANDYIPFIPFNNGHIDDLVDFYSANIQVSRMEKERFITSLSVLIPDLENIEVTQSNKSRTMISIWLKGMNKPLPLSMLGDGATKLFRILAEILVCKGNRLMIDEIDSGIHYSRFKDFIKVILMSAEANDVQIFATTHSIECLNYFSEALNDNKLFSLRENARIFSVVENKDQEVKTIKYKFEEFQYNIANNLEIRGGRE